MRIAVTFQGWEQACCGNPFRVGEWASWNVNAVEPNAAHNHALQEFTAEWHASPTDVPQTLAEGTVCAISAITYEMVPIPGEFRSFTRDNEQPPTVRAVQEVTRETSAVDEFRVELEVGDDWVAPTFVKSAQRVEYERMQAEEQRRREARSLDPVGQQLRRLATDTAERYASVVDVSINDTSSAVACTPGDERGAQISWHRSERDEDLIALRVMDAHWTLPSTVETVSLLRDCVLACAGGDVIEEIERAPDATPLRYTVRIRPGDDVVLEFTDIRARFGGEGSVIMLAGPYARLAAEGRVICRPWVPAGSPFSNHL